MPQVRILSLRPRRRKLHIACGDFFTKVTGALIPLRLLFRKRSRCAYAARLWRLCKAAYALATLRLAANLFRARGFKSSSKNTWGFILSHPYTPEWTMFHSKSPASAGLFSYHSVTPKKITLGLAGARNLLRVQNVQGLSFRSGHSVFSNVLGEGCGDAARMTACAASFSGMDRIFRRRKRQCVQKRVFHQHIIAFFGGFVSA